METLKDKKLDFVEEMGDPSFYYDDVKEAVLEFQDVLESITEENDYSRIAYKEIFGDFTEK